MVLLGIVGLGACAERSREYSEDLQHFEPRDQMTADLDMYVSPSLETYQETDLFEDGLTSQKPVAGTIPRGFMPYPYSNDSTGYNLAGLEWKDTLPNTAEILARGEDLYSIYCMHCHGQGGDADGPVVQNSVFPPPPSFLTGISSRGGAMMDLSEGKVYHTIMYGLNMMGSHASQVSHEDRWMIIKYIKSLQAATLSSEAEESGDAVDGEASASGTDDTNKEAEDVDTQ
jgi:mono/diheme cytochrome c family protein